MTNFKNIVAKNTLSTFKTFAINNLQQNQIRGGSGTSNDTSQENTGVLAVTENIVDFD